MSQYLTFYPLGNAETILLELGNGKKVLFDFADTYTDDNSDKRINLTSELQGIKEFDVVMFSHAHADHVKGAKDFFEFNHAEKYEGNERTRIKELWVSAAFILDTDLDEDARVIRQEARYRLKQQSGIKVFSEPDGLDKWLNDNDISKSAVSHLIIHAGKVLDDKAHGLGDEIQFFIHAPFSKGADDTDDRNTQSIVLQVRLSNDSRDSNILITGDTPHDVLEKIIQMSEANENHEYLCWDIYDIPHHCSYTGLSDEKGNYWTTPTNEIKRLLADYSQQNSVMIASCNQIAESADSDQPPHIEAKRAYDHFSGGKKFLATMEYPNKTNPKPLRYMIDIHGIQEKPISSPNIITSPAPRAG
jgi:beta-lactamase superfamily II metal-dependent hydrolase